MLSEDDQDRSNEIYYDIEKIRLSSVSVGWVVKIDDFKVRTFKICGSLVDIGKKFI